MEYSDQLTKLAEMFGPEELHEDLRPYVQAEEHWTTLKHPLVYQVPYHEALNRQSNLMYAHKLEALAAAQDADNFAKVVWLHERPYRVDAFLDQAWQMGDQEFWELAGQIWVDTENCWQNFGAWREIFEADRDGREYLMDETERDALQKLPARLTVYRGFTSPDERPEAHYKNNRLHSFSWSLERDRALFFAKRYANNTNLGYVAVATVKRDDVIAHFLGRSEDEIVVLPESLKLNAVERVDKSTTTNKEDTANGA